MNKLNNGKYELHALEWDTEYFGVKSAKLDLNVQLCETEMRDALGLLEEYEFITIHNADCNVENARMIASRTNAFVVDTNIQFEKRVTEKTIFNDENIIMANYYPVDEAIVHITETAYENHRFILDRKLAERGGNHIYSEWVRNSACKPDKYFLVERDVDSGSPKTRGFLLFSLSRKSLCVELLGVAKDAQGQGIGHHMWSRLEAIASEFSCENMRVGTQITNLGALSFYVKCGCTATKVNQIHHLWR